MDNAFFSLVPGAEEYPPLQQEIAALFGSDAYTQLSHYTDFVSRFNAIIAAPNSVSPGMRNYLINCNLQDPTNGPIDYRHRDEWITRLAYDNMALTGRTFGVADPENITEADPLGLMLDTAGNPRTDTVIIDLQGANETASDANGPVRIGEGSNQDCTTPLGVAKSAGGQDGLWSTTGETLRYRFWTHVRDVYEAGGSSVVRFFDAGTGLRNRTMTIYVRFADDDHVIDRELIWRQRAASTGHPNAIIIRGYPTDKMPVIRMGSSVNTGAIPNTVPSAPAITMGVSTLARKRIWFRWLDFRGNRDGTFDDGGGDASGRIFAQTMFHIIASCEDISFRYCSLTEFQAIRPDHAQAATYPEYVDIANTGRTGAYEFHGVTCYAPGLDFQYNYVKAADDDIPYTYNDASASGVYTRGLNVEASNATVAYSTFEGFCGGDYIHFTPGSGPTTHLTNIWIHHNVVTCNGYTCLLVVSGDVDTESISDVTIENNFIYNWGTADLQPEGGTGVALFGQGITFRYNVVAGNLDGQEFDDGVTTIGFRIDTMDVTGDADAVSNVDAYGNIFWKCGIQIGNSGGWNFSTAGTSISRIYQNIAYDLSQPNKQEPDGEVSDGRRDAVVVLQTPSSVGLGSNTVDANNFTRSSGDVNAATLLVHRIAGTGGTQYGASGLSGYTNTTTLDPEFSDPDNGDFTVGNATLAAMVAATPKTRAAVGAWTVPT